MDRTITSNSVTLKNTQTEPQKYYFSTKQIIFRVAGLNKKIILDLFSTFRIITVGGFVNQLVKRIGLSSLKRLFTPYDVYFYFKL